MAGIQFFNLLLDAIRQLISADTAFFVNEGQTIFRLAAIIILAWFGAEWGLAGWSVQEGMVKFYNLILVIGFGYIMITFYSVSIPGLGLTFPQIVTREAEWLAQQITYAEVETIINRCSQFYSSIEIPGITDVVGMLAYAVVVVLLLACETLAFIIVAYGLIAEAVCVMLGPIFIPFFVIPRLDWLFWGWLRAFLQFAFYQVVAAAVIYIIGNMLVPAMNLMPQNVTVEVLVAYLPVLVIMFTAGVYAILKIPSLTNNIFSGSAGGGLSSVVIAAAGKVLG